MTGDDLRQRSHPPSRRVMARPATGRHSRQGRRRAGSPRWTVGVVVMGLTIITLIGLSALSAVGAPPPTPSPSATITADPSPAPNPTQSPTPIRTPTATPSPRATPSPSPTPPPRPTPHPDAAPLTPAEFDLDAQVIVIAFPLRADTPYRYRDNWGDPRSGAAEHYNHAHSREADGLRRAHDGIDLYARQGEPVLAPFDGLVVDPATRWQPWIAERYGLTAVIVSEEELSAGYVALLSHLDRLWVKPGQRVRRGEVIGTVGNTGNAEGGPPHLHFELRAPFLLTWSELGEERPVDAFNPYPSLAAADPNRSD